MLPVVIGLDLGTTHCKAIACGSNGEIVGSAKSTYALHSGLQGQAEQDAEEVWQGASHVLHRLASQLRGRASPQALCLSGAMHSVLPIGSSERPLARATTWADSRATPLVAQVRNEANPTTLYHQTGCPLHLPYHPIQLRWWATHYPHATRWVALKDWILFRLTGQWATDLSLASTTGLLNLHHLTWDDEALALAGITAQQLPPLVSPTETIGGLTESAARATKLPQSLPLIAGGSDGTLAMLGLGLTQPDRCAITIGTSGAVRRLTSAPHFDPEARTWCYLLESGGWVAGGAINNGGIVVEWLRQQFYPHLSQEDGYQQIAHDAQSVPLGAEGLLFLPYLSGERSPFWDANARGTFHGLRLAHTRAHFARAALEGIAFCLASVSAALWGEKPPSTPIPLTGGISRMGTWVQIVADVLGRPLVTLEGTDASAVGAARLGQLALDPTLQFDLPPTTQPFAPDPARHAHYRTLHTYFQALTDSLIHLQPPTLGTADAPPSSV